MIIVAVLSSSIERLDTDWFVGRGRIQKNTSISYFGGRRQRIAHAKIQIFPSSVRSVLFFVCAALRSSSGRTSVTHARKHTNEYTWKWALLYYWRSIKNRDDRSAISDLRLDLFFDFLKRNKKFVASKKLKNTTSFIDVSNVRQIQRWCLHTDRDFLRVEPGIRTKKYS
jgi:hypothetical protein